MKKINKLLEDYNKQLTNEQVNEIIYKIFAVFIFLMPIFPEQIGAGIYSARCTLFIVVTMLTTICLFITNRKQLKINVYDILAGIYLILVILSTIFSKYDTKNCILGLNGRGEGLLTIFSYIATFTIFVKGYKYIKKVFKVAIFGACIVCIYGIIQANVPLDVELPFGSSDKLNIAEGTMINQNFLASYLCMFLPMMCYYFLNSKENKGMLAITLLFITLIFTKTLNAYTVCGIALIFVMILTLMQNKNKREVIFKFAIIIFVFIVSFSAIIAVKGNMYLQEILGLRDEMKNLVTQDESFGTGRLAIWKRVLLAIDNNKLLGVGPDSLKLEFRNRKYWLQGLDDVLDSVIIDKAHNEYLHIAVTTGIPSLIIYVALILVILTRLFKIVFGKDKNNLNSENQLFISMLLISILSYLAQAIGNISVVQVAPIFWSILGLGAGITLNENVEKIYKKRKLALFKRKC